MKQTNGHAPVISLRDITKTYVTGTNEYQALKGISLDIHAGDFVAIMGPSGSGKSTTMHIVGALDTPTSGSFLLKGKEISKFSEDELAEIRNKEIFGIRDVIISYVNPHASCASEYTNPKVAVSAGAVWALMREKKHMHTDMPSVKVSQNDTFKLFHPIRKAKLGR